MVIVSFFLVKLKSNIYKKNLIRVDKIYEKLVSLTKTLIEIPLELIPHAAKF